MYHLAELLGIPLPYAVGIMEMLWHYAGVNTPRGDIGCQPDGAIREACGFTRKGAVLSDALVTARWLDRDDEHRLILHDWPDHCEQAVVKLLEDRKHDFLPVYGKSIHDRMKKKSRGSLSEGYEISRDSLASRGAKAKAVGSISGGSAEGGEMRPEFDDQWQAFKKSYWLAGANLIEEDFTRAHHVWRVMDFEQRTLALDGIRLRVAANQWDDPQYIPKPEKYLREEYKRKVIPRKRPQSAAEELASL